VFFISLPLVFCWFSMLRFTRACGTTRRRREFRWLHGCGGRSPRLGWACCPTAPSAAQRLPVPLLYWCSAVLCILPVTYRAVSYSKTLWEEKAKLSIATGGYWRGVRYWILFCGLLQPRRSSRCLLTFCCLLAPRTFICFLCPLRPYRSDAACNARHRHYITVPRSADAACWHYAGCSALAYLRWFHM